MSSPPPDLLQGLLDDNLADLLEDMLPRDGQLNDCGPPSTSGELPSDGFLPSFLPQDFIGTSHGPNHQEMEQSIRCDTISTDPQGLRKRSGSDDNQFEETFSRGVVEDAVSKKQRAHQEKNKRAQKRYRERKKAEAESHKQQVQALTKQLEDLMASKTRLESRCQLLEKVVSLREGTGDLALLGSSSQLSTQAVPEYVIATAAFLGQLYPGQGLETSLRQEHVDRMSAQDFLKVTQDMRARLIRLMLDTSGQPGCPYYQKVIELIEAHRWSTSTILKHDPSRMLKIAYEVRSKRLLHIGSEELDPELMRKVLAAMNLTDAQKRQIVENRRKLLLSLEEVVRKHQAAVEALQDQLPLQFDNVKDSMAYLKAVIRAGDLTDTLSSKHDVCRDFMRELLSSVITPFQEARALMESMPRWPDALMISKMLAEELGDPIAHAKVLNLGPSQPPQLPQAGGFAELLQELPGDSLPGLPLASLSCPLPWLGCIGSGSR